MQPSLTKTIVVVLCLFTAVAAHAETVEPDMPIASVNGTPIMEKTLELRLDQIMQQFMRQGQQIVPAQKEMLREQVFERLIDEEVLYQESVEKEIQVPASDVETRINALRNRFTDEAAYEKALEDMHMSEEEIRSVIRRNLAVKKLVDTVVAPTVSVSDADVQRFYDENASIFKEPEQVKASHILVRLATNADEAAKAEAMKKIADIQEKIAAGEDFAELAGQYSEGPTKVKGGDLGFFTRQQMVKPFSDAAFALEPGEVSDVVTSTFGLHLIKVYEKKPAGTVTLDEAKDEIAEHLKSQKLNSAIAAYVAGLREDAEIDKEL